jgi:hypothetical protein
VHGVFIGEYRRRVSPVTSDSLEAALARNLRFLDREEEIIYPLTRENPVSLHVRTMGRRGNRLYGPHLELSAVPERRRLAVSAAIAT